MAMHYPYHHPREFRHYLEDLFNKKGIVDFADQVMILAKLLECSKSHARRIMNGGRDLSGTRTGAGLNKYAVLAQFFSIPADQLATLDYEYRCSRGARRK